MRDYSNGEHPNLAVVLTEEGYMVGKVGRRFSDKQVQVKQYVGWSEQAGDALRILEGIHQSQLQCHLRGI